MPKARPKRTARRSKRKQGPRLKEVLPAKTEKFAEVLAQAGQSHDWDRHKEIHAARIIDDPKRYGVDTPSPGSKWVYDSVYICERATNPKETGIVASGQWVAGWFPERDSGVPDPVVPAAGRSGGNERWVPAKEAVEYANAVTGVGKDWSVFWGPWCKKKGVKIRRARKMDGTPSKSRAEVELYSLAGATYDHLNELKKATPESVKRLQALREKWKIPLEDPPDPDPDKQRHYPPELAPNL